MSRSRSQRAMSPTRVRPTGPPKNAPAVRPRSSYSSSKSEPFSPLPGASRRQSKGGLRELFSKNKTTKPLDATSHSEERMPNDSTSSPSISIMDASWLPPPLFQAYPQSIKHVTLEASTLSAESILRMNEQKSTNLVYDSEQSTASIPPADITSPTRRPRQGSASVAKAEWTRKIYILTTSGHLLQYSGEGSFHRKPEKILQLGKDSAAFASDAIEGRHFVLHVSQSCSDDGEPDLDASKGLFSRIGIKTANARRSTKVLLMVFETPKDLDSWLSVLRKMIGSLGGRPYSPETFFATPTPPFQPAESQRYLVRRDPHQFSREVPSVGLDAAAAKRSSVQSSTYTVTDLERLRDSKTSNESIATGAPESPLSSPAQEPSALMDVQWLELPDLGPSSLVDFSDHGKRESRLSFTMTDFTRHEYVDQKPTIRLPRRDSLQPRPIAEKSTSIPEMEQRQLQTCETIQEQGAEDDYDYQTSERPVSMVAPLPASFSLRHTAPEMSSSQSYSHFLTTASETGSELPKRYSSLEYSRSFTRSRTPKMAFPQSTPEKSLCRPTSMQLRTDPTSMVVDMPASSSSRCSYSRDGIMTADTTVQHSDVDARSIIQLSQPSATLAFGPPAGPPPSCPLPAVPSVSLPLRRQSHAAREKGLSKSGCEEPLDSS
jgi:hypothetical protein